MTDYVFKSELVKGVLPLGTSKLSEVARDEVSPIFERVRAACDKSNWVKMFFLCRVGVYGPESWTEDSIMKNLKKLRSDLEALKTKLIPPVIEVE